MPIVKKVDDPHTATFSFASPAPANFADSSSALDNVASLGIPSDEINEAFPLIIAPNLVSLPQKALGLCDRYGADPHRYTIRHWRTLVQVLPGICE
jgi:hypothetical protein